MNLYCFLLSLLFKKNFYLEHFRARQLLQAVNSDRMAGINTNKNKHLKPPFHSQLVLSSCGIKKHSPTKPKRVSERPELDITLLK